MSACYRLVLGSLCRSNHHRLAVMALTHLSDDNAAMWRDLFLHHRDKLLAGAKAPDDTFKDFRNHVLHVRDNNWGGAPAAAREWYRRTVRALQQGDWPHAAYCAGVMSHYVVDPVQPFHTGQTEEETIIHRAVEWSFSKSFPEIFLILEQDIGYPDVPVPAGDDWLEKLIISAAKTANQHYETVIDHYDFEVGVKKPEAGLDQELKDTVASLMGLATVLLARVLDRAIAESQAEAPKVSLVWDTASLAITAPARAVLAKIEDGGERKLVNAQYNEFRTTGKVRTTLSDDDKAVRALHAEEVLKIPLAVLDCQWPRETGTKAGTGAAPRVTKKIKKRSPVNEAAAEEETPESVRPETAQKTPEAKSKPKHMPEPAPSAPQSASLRAARIRLSREASVVDAPSIGPKTAGRLSVIGVKTVGDLLELSADDAAKQIKASHINARIIRDWQAQAVLACSIPDLTGTMAQLLVGAGVSSVADLAAADGDFLMDAMAMYAATTEGERALRGQDLPEPERLDSWIAAAREAAGVTDAPSEKISA
jgi:predicted flap endonuclease-1-like 5' DNA nuclease